MNCDDDEDITSTPSEIVTEIQEQRYTYSYNGSFIIVEGTYDSRLFSKFFCSDNTMPMVACGKENVEDVFSQISNKEKGFIAIVDADCDIIQCKQYPYENFFLTDSHDIETMMLETNALESVLAEYADNKKLKEFEQQKQQKIRQILLNSAGYLSYLRYYSDKEKKKWHFKTLSYSQFISPLTLELDTDALHTELKKVNPNRQINDVLLMRLHLIYRREIQDPDKLFDNPRFNYWNFCRGHDLTSILFIGLTRIFGNEKASQLWNRGDIERELRIAYNDGLFKKTQLFMRIKNWEDSNVPYIILKRELVQE
jgi:hypothetical protein